MRSSPGGRWAMSVPTWRACLRRWEWHVLVADSHSVREILTSPQGLLEIPRCITSTQGGQQYHGNNKKGSGYTISEICCGPSYGEGYELLKAVKGWLFEKVTNDADITCQSNHLIGSVAKPFDKRFQLHQKGTFSSQKPSQPYDLSPRYCSYKPQPEEDGQQLNADAIYMEGFPGPVFVRKIRAPAAELKDFKPQPLVLSYHKLSAPRRFSTKTDSEDDQEVGANNSYTEYTKSFKLGPGDSTGFLQNVDVAAKELRIDNIGLLRVEFERDFRPILAFHCLLLPHKISHYTSAYINGPLQRISKRRIPLYLSSLDFMLRAKALQEWQRKPLIDNIIHDRVIVAEDWSNTYGNIELLEYDFESNTSSVRGECDASFTELMWIPGGEHAPGSITMGGIAKLAIVIWKEKQLLWAEIFERVACSDNDFAEVLAALALLMKCEQEMKCGKEEFADVTLWSDSTRACGVITGAQTIRMDDPNRRACLLLRSMKSKFRKLVVVQKPRELMFLADRLLRMDQYSKSTVERAIESWSSALKGSPLFRITRNKRTTSIISTFGKIRAYKKNQGYTYKPKSTFFSKVEKEHKLEELQKLRQFLSPSCMQLVVDGSTEKPLLMEQLDNMFTEANTAGTTTTYRDLVAVGPDKRTLVVVWDASIPRSDYYHKDSCIIILVDDDQEVKQLQQSGIGEINVEMFLYFHRAEFNET